MEIENDLKVSPEGFVLQASNYFIVSYRICRDIKETNTWFCYSTTCRVFSILFGKKRQ